MNGNVKVGSAAARSGEWAQHFSNASCIKSGIVCSQLPYLSHDNFEVLWLFYRPNSMPREFTHLLVGAVYHPPNVLNANNSDLTDYLTLCSFTLLVEKTKQFLHLKQTVNFELLEQSNAAVNGSLAETINDFFVCVSSSPAI